MSAVALPGPSLPFFLDGYGAERIPSPPLLRYQATQDSLTSLNIERNNIDEAGAQELADALKVNSSLTSLNLGCNDIGDAGVGWCSQGQLESQRLEVACQAVAGSLLSVWNGESHRSKMGCTF